MNRHLSSAVLCALLAVVLLAARAAIAAPTVKLVVIVATGSPIKNISKGELKKVFMSDNAVMEGKKLVPFNMSPGPPDRGAFARAVLGMSDEAMQRFWIDRKIRGQPGAPRSLPSADVAIKVAAKFPGAIAYVPAQALTRDVQSVKVDGIAHTDPAYTIAR